MNAPSNLKRNGSARKAAASVSAVQRERSSVSTTELQRSIAGALPDQPGNPRRQNTSELPERRKQQLLKRAIEGGGTSNMNRIALASSFGVILFAGTCNSAWASDCDFFLGQI